MISNECTVTSQEVHYNSRVIYTKGLYALINYSICPHADAQPQLYPETCAVAKVEEGGCHADEGYLRLF